MSESSKKLCADCGKTMIGEKELSLMQEVLFQPFIHSGELVLEVECGSNVGWLFISRLCQGSKGASIWFQNVWLTPNEFQYISGRETAKDWKRSIRHRGRSLKLLMAKGFFDFHPSICVCKGMVTKVNRVKLSEKWTLISPDQNHITTNEPSKQHSCENRQYVAENFDYVSIPPRKLTCGKSDEQCNTEGAIIESDENMDSGRKQSSETKHCISPEPKKESRLTSIIDQLRNSKTKDATLPDIKNKQSDTNSTLSVKNQIEEKEKDIIVGDIRSRPEGGAATPRGPQSPSWSHCDMPTDAALAAASSNAGHNNNATPKTDRGTPEPESSSSPSISPHSPSPARAFPSLLVPGFGLAGLRVSSTAPFSPPPGLERFSPATGNPAIKQMEMMTRNYSDFMRSLAAKYNQNNTQDSFPTPQSNGIVRGFDSSFSYKSGSPFLVRNVDSDGNGSSLTTGLNRKLDNQSSPTPAETRNSNNNNVNSSNPVLSSGSISDFSSSQTLLNLVRTASAQSASQLENYLKGAVKRSADGESRLDPLDLTVGGTALKRPKFEAGSVRDLRNCRDFFHSETETSISSGNDGHGSIRTLPASGTKPSWMSLLDKRMHASPTSSSRTSPKIQNSDQRSRCVSLCVEKSCSSQSEASDLSHWTVDDVVKFVSSVETCSEYAEDLLCSNPIPEILRQGAAINLQE
ncbi:uncharacterized protein [Parasteatoda tepidariorum]|uniref:uncharacterized protein isoform X2 n=1 Tax=Parasteatoda tepidariorum TaxID=114398 RepID=UPI0039BC7D0D